MVIGKFHSPPPQNQYPLTDQQKVGTVYYVHERAPIPNLVQIHPLRDSGQMGEIQQKYVLFLYLFSQVRVQVIPVDGFLHVTAQKT